MKTTQFKRTPDGVKTSRMLEVQKRIGATLEDDYKAKYLDGGWGQKRLADHWGVRRGQIFGQLCKGRRSWVQMLKLPAKGGTSANKDSRSASNQCETCGAHDTVLEAAHWIPVRNGGSSRRDNILKICPNCHKKLDWQEDPATVQRAREIILFRAAKALLQSTTTPDETLRRQFFEACSSILAWRRQS
jgi:hypothetical protein